MGKVNLKGQIEVIIENRNGEVKYHEIKDNAITNAYLKFALYQMMSHNPLNNVTRSTAGGSIPVATSIGTFGIYVMSKPVNIRQNTYKPPYTGVVNSQLHPDVTFYNANGATAESAQVMVPVDGACYFSKGANNEYVIEYVKNTYTGTVRSVVIGKRHSDINGTFQLKYKDANLPPEFYGGADANYILEHLPNSGGTIIYRSYQTTDALQSNLKTKELNILSGVLGTNIRSHCTNNFGCLVVNDTLFKVAKKSASGNSHVATLTYIPNWKNATVIKTLDITFETNEGIAVSTSAIPVLVAKPDENKVEIFLSVSHGINGDGVGAHIKRAIVDVSAPADITYTIEDCGIIPQVISGWGTANTQYMTGTYYEGKYYLPYYYIVTGGGVLSTIGVRSYQEGVQCSLSEEGKITVEDIVNFRSENDVLNAFVIADELEQMQVNTINNYFIVLSQVVSGTNLDRGYDKGANDVLRIRYRYRLS